MALRRKQPEIQMTPPIPAAITQHRQYREDHDWASAYGMLLGLIRAVVIMDETLSGSIAFVTLKRIVEEEDARA